MNKVTHINGNLLDFPDGINVIAHSANCMNIMGGGIAAQIKQRYPEAYDADTSHCQKWGEVTSRLGRFSGAVLADGRRIINLYTQAGIGGERAVDYEAFYTALQTLVAILAETNKNDPNKNYKLGLPHGISCGLAGGDWRIILAMIESISDKYDFPITIVKYTP